MRFRYERGTRFGTKSLMSGIGGTDFSKYLRLFRGGFYSQAAMKGFVERRTCRDCGRCFGCAAKVVLDE